MTFRRRCLALALALCPVAFAGCSQPETQPPLPAASADELEAGLAAGAAAPLAPGLAVVVDHPAYARWSGAAGLADVATGEALTAEHHFRAGSILKIAVAAATLQLVESGERSLDDTLVELLPPALAARIPGADAITLRMLLGHTSGIPEFVDDALHLAVAADPLHQWTLDELLDRALARPPAFPPGEGFVYSNTNYLLLGEILTATAGAPWRTVVAERVFARAGLVDTVLPPVGDAACPGCASGYQPAGGALRDVTSVDPSMAGAAGGCAMITTAADLATLLRALTDGELFDSPDTLDLMLEFRDATDGAGLSGYGLGLERYQVDGVTVFGHLGGTAGYHSFVVIEPDSGVVASGFMTVRGNIGAFIVPVLDIVARIPAP